MAKISVIVPVYNVEKYLQRCVDSILSQTFPDFELFLVDDGSLDGSAVICDEYSEADCRVRVIHQKNQGQAAARNHAVFQAVGEWICFVDSDDVVHPQMLELLYVAAEGNNAELSMCAAIEGDYLPSDFYTEKEVKPMVKKIDEEVLSNLYNTGEHYCWVVWGKLIRTEIVRKIFFTEGKIYEDNAVVCKWLYKAKKVVCLQEQLYFYMINPDGTTKSQFDLKKLDYLWALEEIIRFYKRVGYTKLRRKFCTEYMITAVNYLWKVQGELHKQDIANEIGKRMQTVYLKNLGFIKLPANYKEYAYDAMFPRGMRLYGLAKSGLTILNADGLFVFVNKVVKCLHRGEKK